jgi:hypothetical protein
MATAPQAAAALPREVHDLAARLGVVVGSAPLSSVTLRQRGTMRDRPRGRAIGFHAVQNIDLRRSEFAWRASTGPFGCISVLDALKDGEASLELRAFRLLRIAGVRGGAAAAKGEIMRYLAELAWAPDAIVYNPSLSWTVIDGRTLRVSAGRDHARGEVELQLDESGRIARVSAQDRPRKEGSGFVERPWRGHFFDYRKHQERLLPFAGEVGWILDGQTFIAWHGEMLSWHTA